MTTIKTFIGTVALLAASTVFAQTGSCVLFPKGDEDGQGTIGRRYAEGFLSFQDVKGTSKNVFGGGVGGNLPVCTGLDFLGSVSHTSFKANDLSTTLTNFDGVVRAYGKVEDDVTPFIQAGLGMTFGDVLDHSTNWINWNVGVGADFSYKWASVTPTISYSDDFRHTGASSQALTYAVEVNSWATPQIGVFAKVSYVDVRHDGANGTGLTAGLRVRF